MDCRDREVYQQSVLPEVEVLLRVALGLTGQPADAEDLVQETLLRAWRSIGTFDGRHPRAWLLTILRNSHINGGRRRRPVLLNDPESQLDRPRTSEHAPSAEDVALSGTFDAAVETAVSALPSVFREVLLLVDVQGLPAPAVAAALGIPEGTVVSRLHRARNRVRTSLLAAGLGHGRQA